MSSVNLDSASRPRRGRKVKPMAFGGAAPVQVATHVANVRAYEPVSSLDRILARPWQEPLKLDWNESTIPPSPKVAEAIQEFMARGGNLNWYPDLHAARLVEALAEYTGRQRDQILVTNGSDDALDLLCKTYLDPEERVLLPYPTYTHFLVYAGARGVRFDPVTYEDPFVGQIDRIINGLTPWTKLIYLVNPNNPTGVLFSPDEVERLLQVAPQTLVVVDEAYFEFAGATVAPLTDRYPNLVVTRTFSKSFGIAGLRVGYIVAHPAAVRDLRRVHNPKSVNVMGQIAARAAVQDREYLQAYLDAVDQSKRFLVRSLRERGYEARSTAANWILVRVPNPRVFCASLAEEGVYVRNRSSFPQLNGYVRISVGTRPQMEALLDRIDRAERRTLA